MKPLLILIIATSFMFNQASSQFYYGAGVGASHQKVAVIETQVGYILSDNIAFQASYFGNVPKNRATFIGKFGLYNPIHFLEHCEDDRRWYLQPMLGLGRFTRELNKEIVTEWEPVLSFEVGKRIADYFSLYSGLSYNGGIFALTIGVKVY